MRLGGPVAAALAGLLLAAPGCAHLRPPGHLPLGTPLRLQVQDPAGHRVVLRGTPGKVTVVVFWASWCARCLDRLADARRLTAAATDTDVIPVNLDVDARFASWDARRLSLPAPVYRDPGARAATELGVSTLPTILFVGRQGNIIRAIEGVHADATWRLRRALARVLAGDHGAGPLSFTAPWPKIPRPSSPSPSPPRAAGARSSSTGTAAP